MHVEKVRGFTSPQQTHSVYQALPFYLIRTPLLPVEQYLNLLAGSDLLQPDVREQGLEHLVVLSHDPVIREAIAVASLSLLDSLKNLQHPTDPRKREQAVKGFLRYLLRMSTRPTPFGLFSGVTFGKVGEQTEIALRDLGSYRKRSRPDMEWLLNVIQRLESRYEVVRQLSVTANGLASLQGSRAVLPFLTGYGQVIKQGLKTHMQSASIRATPVVQWVLETVKEPVPFQKLAEDLHQQYPDTSLEQISQFLYALFQQEFLLSDLRPPLHDTATLPYLLERLAHVEGIEDTFQPLQEIAHMINRYDELVIGEGETLYRELVAKMKQLADTKSTLQVDLALEAERMEINRAVTAEVERVAEVLWRISDQKQGFTSLRSYQNNFMETYGPYREVPLLELLDEDHGLGAPPTYEYPQSKLQVTGQLAGSQQKRDQLMTQWYLTALQTGAMEVELTDERVAELEMGESDPTVAPRSLELYFSLEAASQEAVDAGDYQLVVSGMLGSEGAGKAFGRFSDLLGEGLRNCLDEVQQHEQDLHPEAIFAEVVYMPVDGRAVNVVLSPNIRPYEICIGTTPSKTAERSLSLSDLYVGCTEDGFYLRSKSLDREVIPVAGHMLNTQQSPNVYRFLREISMERQRNWLSYAWYGLDHAPMLPRLRYGRAILSAARWKLNASLDPFRMGMNAAEWQDAFEVYSRRWQVPRYVYLSLNDQRILLDLEHPLHREVLYNDFIRLQAGESLTLTESGLPSDGRWVTNSDGGHFMMEAVFPLVRRPEYRAPSGLSPLVRGSRPTIPKLHRTRMPGSEWLYVKWYGVAQREEELIAGPLREVLQQAEQQGWAQLSYFIRYADPTPHLRLRFCGDPARLTADLLPWLHRVASQCVHDGTLSKMVIESYEPELERYGGPALMPLAEHVFSVDSRLATHWSSLQYQSQLNLPLDMVAVISVLDIFENIGLGQEEQLRWLEEIVSHKQHLDLFRLHRIDYLRYANPSGGFAGLRDHPDAASILPLLQHRSHALQRYAEGVHREHEAGTLMNGLQNLVQSVIHMHLNRLFGIDREREQRVLTLARHTLNALVQQRRSGR